jgi:transposase
MLTTDQIDSIHRLRHAERWSIRRIARHLHIGRGTVALYLDKPSRQRATPVQRASILDPFKTILEDCLQQDRGVPASLLLEKIRQAGYRGGYTIVKDYLQQARPQSKRAFARMEPLAGQRFDIDWAHFGTLTYNGSPRKLYAFCLVECHSRKLYVEFTHSLCFETFIRCHLHAFTAMQGIAHELWYDNLSTAVAEHDGNLVRFQPRFLAFARDYGFYPRACHVAAGWEKGKVERAIGYLRTAFWPLRTFTDLADVNHQARQWTSQIANQRKHRETGQTPEERFQPAALRPLPTLHDDYRDTAGALVHKDTRLSFDGNRYCVPPRYAGQQLVIKADAYCVTIYDNAREVTAYPRCYGRNQIIGAEKFQQDLAAQLPAVKRSAGQQRLLDLLGTVGEPYLQAVIGTGRPLEREIGEMLVLIREYGQEAAAQATARALEAKAIGASYVANLLRQQFAPRVQQPPVELKDRDLLSLIPEPPRLFEYDALLLQQDSSYTTNNTKREALNDSITTKANTTQSDNDQPQPGADFE